MTKVRKNSARVRVTHTVAWSLAFVMLALTALGCSSEPAEVGTLPAHLLLVRDDVVIDEYVWQTAPAGCEGRLDHADVEVAWAEGAPSLAVIIDTDGAALCVDTWESIEIEIQKVMMGDPSPDPGLVAMPSLP